MITIDRSSSTTVQEQLTEQLRYLIASGQFKVETTLPSTRTLAEQVGVSFHTVRKAYQQLEREGLLESRVGSGYRVKERTPLSKSERMERGAAVVQESLQRLIGFGLQEPEIEYLMQEQLALLEGAAAERKLLLAAPSREIAYLCAEQVSRALQQPVEGATLQELARHRDADFVFVAYAQMRAAMDLAGPRADVLGFVAYLSPEALERVVRLLPDQTLGIVTRHADAIQPLMKEIREATGFAGQMIAASIDEGTKHLPPFVGQADLLVYTPPARRALLPFLEEGPPYVPIAPVLSRDALETIRQRVPA